MFIPVFTSSHSCDDDDYVYGDDGWPAWAYRLMGAVTVAVLVGIGVFFWLAFSGRLDPNHPIDSLSARIQAKVDAVANHDFVTTGTAP